MGEVSKYTGWTENILSTSWFVISWVFWHIFSGNEFSVNWHYKDSCNPSRVSLQDIHCKRTAEMFPGMWQYTWLNRIILVWLYSFRLVTYHRIHTNSDLYNIWNFLYLIHLWM
jgi:hypothetical protein